MCTVQRVGAGTRTNTKRAYREDVLTAPSPAAARPLLCTTSTADSASL